MIVPIIPITFEVMCSIVTLHRVGISSSQPRANSQKLTPFSTPLLTAKISQCMLQQSICLNFYFRRITETNYNAYDNLIVTVSLRTNVFSLQIGIISRVEFDKKEIIFKFVYVKEAYNYMRSHVQQPRTRTMCTCR